jgi:hypothetical protein
MSAAVNFSATNFLIPIAEDSPFNSATFAPQLVNKPPNNQGSQQTF